jgi:hypothetical protein
MSKADQGFVENPDRPEAPQSTWEPGGVASPSSEVIQPTCSNGHSVAATDSFCPQCGLPLASQRAAISANATVSPKKKRRALTIVATAVGLVLLVIAGGVAWYVSTAGTTTVTGGLTLVDAETASSGCNGQGGYSDIDGGAQVILTDEGGKILGSGSLSSGTPTGSTACVYGFSISDIPTDREQYAIEVSRRGKVVNSRDELIKSGWKFQLSLGS